jgi:hypothetical protein
MFQDPALSRKRPPDAYKYSNDRGGHMDDSPALLEREAQEQIERVLETPGLPAEARKLKDPEARAALAQLARHSAKFRTAALAIMPHTPRYNLLGAGMVTCEEGNRQRWVLTQLGQQSADALAAAMPQPSDEDRQLATARLDALLDEADLELDAHRSSQQGAQPKGSARKLARTVLGLLRSRGR